MYLWENPDQEQRHIHLPQPPAAMIAAAISREAPRPTFATAIQSPRQRSCPGTQLRRAISRARGAVRPAGVAHQPLVPPPDLRSDGTPQFGRSTPGPETDFCHRHPIAPATELSRDTAPSSNLPRTRRRSSSRRRAPAPGTPAGSAIQGGPGSDINISRGGHAVPGSSFGSSSSAFGEQ